MVKENFIWLSGAVWLDFVNTEAIVEGERTDLLPDFGALLDWLVAARLLAPPQAAELLTRPLAWREAAFEAALHLRAVLRRLCEKSATEAVDFAEQILKLNEFLAQPSLIEQLRFTPERFEVEQHWQIASPSQLVQPVAHNAAHSWSAGDLRYLKPCANPNCILWFLDTSKNHSRRWCSMEICGNRHKVAQHYARKKSG